LFASIEQLYFGGSLLHPNNNNKQPCNFGSEYQESKLDEERPLFVPVTPVTTFYHQAEDYHQDYLAKKRKRGR
jgi:peptide methionine sulfoxide reductase MsrA